ncbi:MAG: helix-turn-helix domain-containing protein [Sphingobacterium sp.]|jgi:transcriptional regulator with XRE-family HTH domain|uniref:helix-turn-helix domain-containing protein n=1 Tax=Sphingobacterium sp. TaxID=341027 RepID=UPI00283C082A|nr:helix-turn-helix transcriptional regulator [Sphingobacterium sp.]MDR3009463.1 helix-turn-helix domain-containing protein [Sphingobacterium sp.]
MIEDKHSKTYKAIGKNLRKRRNELDLTQDEVAERIPKMDRSKISDMENGKEDFVFSKLLNLCDALDLSVIEALKEEEDQKE